VKKSIFEKSVLFVSALLLVTSAYMYLNMDKNQVQLQAPSKSLFAEVQAEEKTKTEDVKNNPYVIWHGSNAMPEGMGQGDNKPEFMPKWQQDKIKDVAERGGITPAPRPESNQTSSQDKAPNPDQQQTPDKSPAPSPGQGGGITPSAFDGDNPDNSGNTSMP